MSWIPDRQPVGNRSQRALRVLLTDSQRPNFPLEFVSRSDLSKPLDEAAVREELHKGLDFMLDKMLNKGMTHVGRSNNSGEDGNTGK